MRNRAFLFLLFIHSFFVRVFSPFYANFRTTMYLLVLYLYSANICHLGIIASAHMTTRRNRVASCHSSRIIILCYPNIPIFVSHITYAVLVYCFVYFFSIVIFCLLKFSPYRATGWPTYLLLCIPNVLYFCHCSRHPTVVGTST